MPGLASEEQNHWPGYGDALTAMTMMLIFVTAVLTVAFFGLSQNVSRSMVEKIAKAISIDNLADSGSTDKLASRVVARLESQQHDMEAAAAQSAGQKMAIQAESLKPMAPDHVFASADRVASNPVVPACMLRQSDFITVAFVKRATGIDAETGNRIKAAMESSGHLSESIELKAFVDESGSISDTRRVAFYRLPNLRGKLMAMGVAQDRIRTRIEDAAGNEGSDIVRIDLARTG
jgi:hypothetical protein